MLKWEGYSSRAVGVATRITGLSAMIGAIVGASRATQSTLWADIGIGALIGLTISLCCLTIEFQVFSNSRRRMARRLRPIVLMVLRGMAYSAFVVAGLSLPGLLTDAPFPWQTPDFLELFVISSTIAFAFSTGVEITRLLGKEATLALVTGRYAQARLENRVILFADVIGSTALAETIGQLRFHDFLRDVAQDLAIAVETTRGDVHKYVGDAVIVTWPQEQGTAQAACLTCAREMHRSLSLRAPYYLRHYGVEAQIRVALHSGQVAAGEIGDWKKEIALLGDPMNTTARIEGAAKALNADIVLSEDLVRQLPQQVRQTLVRLQPYAVAGKHEKLELWRAERSD